MSTFQQQKKKNIKTLDNGTNTQKTKTKHKLKRRQHLLGREPDARFNLRQIDCTKTRKNGIRDKVGHFIIKN